jgi:hypothetical protein
MSDMPAWYGQLTWSHPIAFSKFVSDTGTRDVVADGAGLYAFTMDPAALSPRNVLYVGKADGARQTLRKRIGVYERRLRRPQGPPSKHAGLELLCARYVASPSSMFVRWCGCILTRDVEGGLIDLFDPPCNNKEERIGLDDDELIPDIYLYDV